MKKIAWFAPALIVTPMAFAAACGGPAEMDGSGGTDGSGGNDPTGGSANDGTGGSSDGAGGSTGGSTGGGDVGGMGGLGGLGGMGGFGGGSGDALQVACETMCEVAIAGDASDCDEPYCVYLCTSSSAYYGDLGCEAEYLDLKECSAQLDGSEFFCQYDTVGTTGCLDEQLALAACYN